MIFLLTYYIISTTYVLRYMRKNESENLQVPEVFLGLTFGWIFLPAVVITKLLNREKLF